MLTRLGSRRAAYTSGRPGPSTAHQYRRPLPATHAGDRARRLTLRLDFRRGRRPVEDRRPVTHRQPGSTEFATDCHQSDSLRCMDVLIRDLPDGVHAELVRRAAASDICRHPMASAAPTVVCVGFDWPDRDPGRRLRRASGIPERHPRHHGRAPAQKSCRDRVRCRPRCTVSSPAGRPWPAELARAVLPVRPVIDRTRPRSAR